MRKSGWMALFACMLLCLCFVPASASATPLDVRIKGRIQIGPDGGVVDYRLSQHVPAVVEDVLQATVRGWKFEPVVIDGRAVNAETGILLMLDAWPKGGGLALRVRGVAFGAHEGTAVMTPPHYPPAALRDGIEGQVVLLLRVDAEGDVLEAAVEQTSLSERVKARHFDTYAGQLEAAALGIARGWRFGVSERVDGVPVGGTLRVPVVFQRSREIGGLRAGELRTAPWRSGPASDSQAGLPALAGGETQSLDSVFRLLDTVVGVELEVAAGS